MDTKPFRRNRFFAGRLLTAEDYEAEQAYHIGKRRLLNRCMYGCRIVSGLEINLSSDEIVIQEGLALDCCGREVFVPAPAKLKLPERLSPVYLVIEYQEFECEEVPSYDAGLAEGAQEFSRIVESFRLSWATENPLDGHRRLNGGWICCEREHALPLARLIPSNNRFALDYLPGQTDE